MAGLVNKAARVLLAASVFLAASGCTHGNAREHARITRLSEIPLHPGINKVEMMVPDGRTGMIVEGQRQTATVYLVMLPDESGTGWTVVTADAAAPALVAEGGAATIRFARGWLDGAPETLLFTATRDADEGEAGPVAYTIDIERLATGRKSGAPSRFERVSETRSNANYSSADEAMQGETGLP
jgi:hypothetical protein